MNQSGKLVLFAVILILVLGTIWWYGQSAVPTPQTQNENQQAATSQNNQTNGTSISATDASDVTLNKDLATIDSQMQGLTMDSQNIDKGLNDQPVSQN